MSDGFRANGNCGGESCPHSGGLSEEEFRKKEEKQGTWEGKVSAVNFFV